MKQSNYHEKAQGFIKGAKAKGMTVKAEGQELIAYPKNYKKPSLLQKVENTGKNVIKSIGKGLGKVMAIPGRAIEIERGMNKVDADNAKRNVANMNAYRNVPISAPNFKKPKVK